MKYTPDIESINKHEVPEWFHDAKLGIFIHWGLFSVPAFAITGIDMMKSLGKGVDHHMKNNPYAEWYLNTMKIEGSPTQKYHEETYGKDFSYDDFVPMFNEAVKKWNPNEWQVYSSKSVPDTWFSLQGTVMAIYYGLQNNQIRIKKTTLRLETS